MKAVPARALQDTAFRQAVGLPQTATPAGMLALFGAMLLAVGLLLIVLIYGLPRIIASSVSFRGVAR